MKTSVEENLRIIDARREAVNAKDMDRFEKFHANSVITHAPMAPEPLKGRAALRGFVEGFFVAFPDMRATTERSFGQGDWVCTESVFTGTHTGPLQPPMGPAIPPTNRSFRVVDCTTFKLEGGEVTEVHSYFDVTGMMAQLGLLPGT